MNTLLATSPPPASALIVGIVSRMSAWLLEAIRASRSSSRVETASGVLKAARARLVPVTTIFSPSFEVSVESSPGASGSGSGVVVGGGSGWNSAAAAVAGNKAIAVADSKRKRRLRISRVLFGILPSHPHALLRRFRRDLHVTPLSQCCPARG